LTAAACALLGRSRASHDRSLHLAAPAPKAPRPSPPNALSEAERQQILQVLNSARFCDKSVAQTWATLLDEGVYLASRRMHRLLRSRESSRDRRRQATHPARAKPELLATHPGDVWSWDLTKLRGPDRGV